MFAIPDTVRQDLVTLVPVSLINEISCFAFYDEHPKDKKNVDIIICTLRGEIQEFYKRDLVNCTLIDNCLKPQNIRIFRNSKCELFYLVSCKDQLIILSRKDNLQVLHIIKNVEYYSIEDAMCKGRANIKIIYKDDAVPLFFDDDFEKVRDRSEILSIEKTDDSLPLITQLSRKFTEAKYSVQCNKKVLSDLLSIRHHAAYSDYKKNSAQADHMLFSESNNTKIIGPLKVKKSMDPWIKISNKKVTIILEVINKSTVPVDNIHTLLHTTQLSTVYTTKLFTSAPNSPFWKEKCLNTITNCENTAVVIVIDLKELKGSITDKILLKGAISYQCEAKEYLLPFKDIYLSSQDTMGENFDVLSIIQKDSHTYNILSLLATSEQTELSLRHIKKENEVSIKLLTLFSNHLNMEKISNMDNVVVHMNSPFHILHGVLVIEQKNIGEDKWIISLHTRVKDQILAFIHYMYDSIPHRIVAATIEPRITAIVPQTSKYVEDISAPSKTINCSEFKSSLLKQTLLTLEYLDECMIKMNENKNPAVQSRIGSEIDVFAGGVSEFKIFKSKIVDQAERAITSIHEETYQGGSEGTYIHS